ncbi:uncharacterized protein LOC131738100 [Acipenser ruthenus]|uniref:uncharacterized protein LOC131738100 n=1 Tax=Acipenser ruthenus TaxID=7906 RepID=UPI002740F7C1|nr:uncharacterized protein LOC131738100 [Acipenser ruthenus]
MVIRKVPDQLTQPQSSKGGQISKRFQHLFQQECDIEKEVVKEEKPIKSCKEVSPLLVPHSPRLVQTPSTESCRPFTCGPATTCNQSPEDKPKEHIQPYWEQPYCGEDSVATEKCDASLLEQHQVDSKDLNRCSTSIEKYEEFPQRKLNSLCQPCPPKDLQSSHGDMDVVSEPDPHHPRGHLCQKDDSNQWSPPGYLILIKQRVIPYSTLDMENLCQPVHTSSLALEKLDTDQTQYVHLMKVKYEKGIRCQQQRAKETKRSKRQDSLQHLEYERNKRSRQSNESTRMLTENGLHFVGTTHQCKLNSVACFKAEHLGNCDGECFVCQGRQHMPVEASFRRNESTGHGSQMNWQARRTKKNVEAQKWVERISKGELHRSSPEKQGLTQCRHACPSQLPRCHTEREGQRQTCTCKACWSLNRQQDRESSYPSSKCGHKHCETPRVSRSWANVRSATKQDHGFPEAKRSPKTAFLSNTDKLEVPTPQCLCCNCSRRIQHCHTPQEPKKRSRRQPQVSRPPRQASQERLGLAFLNTEDLQSWLRGERELVDRQQLAWRLSNMNLRRESWSSNY